MGDGLGSARTEVGIGAVGGGNHVAVRHGERRRVKDRLADILEVEPSSISESASFVDDLDADSLALIELVEALEEEVGQHKAGFHIDDEDLEDLKTVRDAVEYVMAKL